MADKNNLREMDELGRPLNVLTHANCPDGATAEGLLRRARPDAKHHQIHPSDVYKHLQQVKPGESVVLADLSMQTGQETDILAEVQRIQKQGGRVTWIDHHAPQWQSPGAKQVLSACDYGLVDYENKQSGALLTLLALRDMRPGEWREYEYDESHVTAISGRDTWQNPMDRLAITLGLISRDREHYVERVSKGQWANLALEGSRLYEQHEQWVLDGFRRIIPIDDKVAYVHGPCPISDVAEWHWGHKSKAEVLLHFNTKGSLSIRSRKGTGHAHAIAAQLGGGGHPEAAGYRFITGWWQRLKYRVLGDKHPFIDQAIQTAQQVTKG